MLRELRSLAAGAPESSVEPAPLFGVGSAPLVSVKSVSLSGGHGCQRSGQRRSEAFGTAWRVRAAKPPPRCARSCAELGRRARRGGPPPLPTPIFSGIIPEN